MELRFIPSSSYLDGFQHWLQRSIARCFYSVDLNSRRRVSNRQLSISYQNQFPSEVIASTSAVFERRKSTGWLDVGDLPASVPGIVDCDVVTSGSTSQSADDYDDDGDHDARRALDEIESIHLRLLAEMSDVDDDFDERHFFDVFVADDDDPVRRCRSVGCLSTSHPFDVFYAPDDRRSRSSFYLDVPQSFSEEGFR